VVVAVGPLSRGKSRLGPSFDGEARRGLVLAMLQDVLAAVRAAHRGAVFVVTPDPEVDPVAQAHGAEVLRDAGAGTNAAIEAALADERVATSGAVLMVQGDLPHLTGAQVSECLEALTAAGKIAVLVPNDDGGTSALGLRPPKVIATAFGPQSGQGHRDAAAAAAVELRELRIAGLAADVDTVEDLERVREMVGPATAAVLAAISVGTEGGAAP
jgi:2-phospho-L-lactate guanylyltransferase